MEAPGAVTKLESIVMGNVTCWRDGCTTPKDTWGMCTSHRREWDIEVPRLKTRMYGVSESDRLWAYAKRRSVEECWLWHGALDSNGYAVFNLAEASGGGQAKAHRYAYTLLRGSIPEEIDGEPAELDHRCRIRPCCNPWHLEVVTQAVNTMRGIGFGAQNAAKTHCDSDHEFTEENTYRGPDGYRRCRICMAGHNRGWRERNGLSVPATPYGSPAEPTKSHEEYLADRRAKNPPKSGVRGKGAYQLDKDRCPEGHRYEGDNLLIEKRKKKDGTYREVRRCRTCVNARARDNHEKRTR